MYFRVRSLFVASAVIVTSQPLPPRDSFTDFLPLNRSFEFQVNCGSLTEFNCAQVKLGLKTVGNLIAAEILFKVPILVGVTFVEESFSHFHKYSIMLGTQPAIAAQKVNGSKLGQMFSYPNILIKQTNDEYSVFLAKKFSSEIASRIDSLKLPDIDFKFNNAWANSTQFQSTFCSQETVAYLITVSLGFETELHVTRIDRKKLSKQVLVTNRKKISKSTYYMTFVSPFDGLLVLRDRNEKRTIPFFSRKTVVVSIASWAKKLEKILLKATKYISSNIDDYGDLFQGDQRLAGEAEKIANILTYGNISAKFSDNTELALELALETLSDSLYATADSNELLMSREDADRTKLNFSERPSLQDLVNTQGSLYGPGTLKVLQEIGWPTRRSPNPVNLKKVVISNPIVNASKQVQMKAELHRFYLLIKCPTVPCEENSSDWNFL